MPKALQALDHIVARVKHQLNGQLNRQFNGQALYRFLSISLEIKRVDPLALVQGLESTSRSFFYMENRQHQIAVMGLDVVTSRICEGNHRFPQARTFVQACLADTLTLGEIRASLSGPHFFCTSAFEPNNAPKGWHNCSFSDATIVLPRWQIMRSPERCVLVANLRIDRPPHSVNGQIDVVIQEILQGFQQIEELRDYSAHPTKGLREDLQGNYVISPDIYKSGVKRAVQAIGTDQLQKIVLANAFDVEAPHPFRVATSLQILRQTYPDCYVFAVRHGEGATFLGASPEVLLRTRDRQLVTEAMAGSAPRGQTQPIDTDLAMGLLQGQKERHEHQVVVAFIVDRLHQLGLTPQVPDCPRLRQLSNIQHLCTSIQAYLPASIHPLDILAQLHPTPAMAGFPRDRALAELQNYEPFDRLLYAAPLGWVDAHGNSEFVVGIRSALIYGNHARLYAGAGIVAGSNPEQELAEVQLKLRALLDALVYGALA